MPAVYSPDREGFLHLGKLSPKPVRDSVPFSYAKRLFLKAGGTLPKFPNQFGHGADFTDNHAATDGGWGMLGNGPCDDNSIPSSWAAYQGAGDCAWAGPAREEMEAAKNAKRAIPKFTSLVVLEQYSAYSGYNLQTGANDNGSAIADVIKWRQDKGLKDANGIVHKIGQAFDLTPGNLQELWEATYLLETVGIGWEVQQAQMDQFNAGQPWEYVPGSPIIGGHYVNSVGRTGANNTGVISWSQRKGCGQLWYEKLNDESVGYLDPLRYNAVTGETAEGYTAQDVEKFLSLLAKGQT